MERAPLTSFAPFTPDEREELAILQREFGVKQIQGYLLIWWGTIQEMQRGDWNDLQDQTGPNFRHRWDEYAFSIAARTVLQRFIERAQISTMRKIIEAVAPWDEAYREATVPWRYSVVQFNPADTPAAEPNAGAYWWERRLPRGVVPVAN